MTRRNKNQENSDHSR